MVNLNEKKDCTACSACVESCPVACITLLKDKEGFLYPYANENCIRCGKCEKVCPIKHQNTVRNKEKKAFAAISKDEKIWEKSSSGGAFSEICHVIAKGTSKCFFFGATMDFPHVYHKGVDIEHLYEIRKSKYIQSEMRNCFYEIKQLLYKDFVVVFSGTPCQVAGLKAFLNKKYDNLICIDLICHGAGSTEVFKKCIDYEEKKTNKKICNYEFRFKKKKFGNYPRHISKIQFNDGSKELIEYDSYNQFFLEQLCLRPSCGENCIFRNENRYSDITLADFNRKEDIFPKLNDMRSYSTIVANTDKGVKIVEKLYKNMELFDCDIEYIKNFNPLFSRTTSGNAKRDEFFRDFINGESIEILKEKYISRNRNIRNLNRFVPWKVKHFVNVVYHILYKGKE